MTNRSPVGGFAEVGCLRVTTVDEFEFPASGTHTLSFTIPEAWAPGQPSGFSLSPILGYKSVTHACKRGGHTDMLLASVSAPLALQMTGGTWSPKGYVVRGRGFYVLLLKKQSIQILHFLFKLVEIFVAY